MSEGQKKYKCTAATRAMHKTILLDRDGVLNRDLPESVCCAEQLEMLPGSLEALRLLAESNYRVLVVTNQACVGRGEISPHELETIHRKLCREAAAAGGRIDDIFVCTHAADEQCGCRKPKPGLILQAQREWRFEPADTCLVGDDIRDVEAAVAAGCIPILVHTGKGCAANKRMPDVAAFADLLAFVKTVT